MKALLHKPWWGIIFRIQYGDRRTEAGHQGEHPQGIGQAVAVLFKALIYQKNTKPITVLALAHPEHRLATCGITVPHDLLSNETDVPGRRAGFGFAQGFATLGWRQHAKGATGFDDRCHPLFQPAFESDPTEWGSSGGGTIFIFPDPSRWESNSFALTSHAKCV